MVEFVVVGPVITLLGLSLLQYGMLFFAKNQINHASFMAARASAMGNAQPALIENAYIDALVPLYGGGTDAAQLNAARDAARSDLIRRGLLDITLMNPARESFDDWNDAGLQQTIGNGRRVIPNAGLATKDPNDIGGTSGQNIHDANLIKLRITHGYEPKVPLVGAVYNRFLRLTDQGREPHYSAIVNAGRIPAVTHVTLQMHSDAIEPDNPVSLPGNGNNGSPAEPDGGAGNVGGGNGGAPGSGGGAGRAGGSGAGNGSPEEPPCL